MPEGHSIHRLARDMAELVGQEISATSPQRRFAADAVDGAEVTAIEAYGKNLLIDLTDTAGNHSPGPTVHVHLGMRGKWLRFAPVTGPGLPQVRLRLATPEVAWDLIAPSRCDLLDIPQRSALIERLGPDPLRPETDPAEARRRIAAYAGPIGAALLDQSVIAGVGNVFRAEALHAVGVAPERPAAELTDDEFTRLWDTLTAMMATATDDGRIITVPVMGDRLAVPEDQARRVYKQAACYDCGTPVLTSDVGARTAYTCPSCQPG